MGNVDVPRNRRPFVDLIIGEKTAFSTKNRDKLWNPMGQWLLSDLRRQCSRAQLPGNLP